MAIGNPKVMDFEWIQIGNDQIGAYTGEIIDSFTTSSRPLIRATYYRNYLPREDTMRMMAAVNLAGKGRHVQRLHVPVRKDIPDINGILVSNLISSRTGNILTLNTANYTGQFQQGDWLQVGAHALFINYALNNQLTIHNLPHNFDSLPSSRTCTTRIFEFLCIREGFGYTYTQESLKKFDTQPISFREVI